MKAPHSDSFAQDTPQIIVTMESVDPSLDPTLAVMRRVMTSKFGIADGDLTLDRELSTLGLDSLAFIEYMFELESEFNVHFSDVPSGLATVGDLARFVHDEVAYGAKGVATK